MENRQINQDNLEVEFKQDYININRTVAISAEGTIFKLGDVVHHEGTENRNETAKILKFTIDVESYDIIAHTKKGRARISFLYH